MEYPSWQLINSVGTAGAIVISAISIALLRRSRARSEEVMSASQTSLSERSATSEQWLALIRQLREQLGELSQQSAAKTQLLLRLVERDSHHRAAVHTLYVWAMSAGHWMRTARDAISVPAGEELRQPPPPPRLPESLGERIDVDSYGINGIHDNGGG